MIMKNKIICLLLPLFLLSCSKKSASDSTTPSQPESTTEINGMADNKDITASPTLPFQVTEVWPDAESKDMDDIDDQVVALIKDRDFDSLDELAAKLRASKEAYANGLWKLSEVYASLVPPDEAAKDEWENRMADLHDWVDAKPDSINARVALAYFLASYAWNARGGGYANTVKDDDWKLFNERLNEAMDVLKEAKNLNLKEPCPVYWSTMMKAALGLQLDRNQFDDIFNQAIDNTPVYVPIYRQRAVYLMPRWDGSEGELESDLEKSADRIGGDDGDMLYAQVVWNIHTSASSDNVFKENNFSWPRVNRGFAAIEKRFPDSLAAISEHAYLAAYAGDDETTREYLKKTEGKADLAVWYYKNEYIRVANWAFEK